MKALHQGLPRALASWVAWAWRLGLLAAALCSGAALAGEVPGVRAVYYNWSGTGTPSIPSGSPVADQVEDKVDALYLSGSPTTGVSAENYLVRYTGFLLVPASGAYTFQIDSDDGVRFYLDCDLNGSFSASELLLEQWVDQSTATYSAACSNTLVAGQRYAFQYDFYNHQGEASARLSWTGPAPVGSSFVAVPRGNGSQGLYSGVNDSTPPTLTGTSLACGANTMAYLSFSEKLDPGTAQTSANYQLSGGHSVSAAQLLSDGRTVALSVTPGITSALTVTVSGVRDLAGNAIASGASMAIAYATNTLSAGLTGSYYDQDGTQGAYFTGSMSTRTDATLNFDWSTGSTGVGSLGSDNFSVRWTGVVQIPSTGSYTFQTTSDDGVRLYVNGGLVISNWGDHSAATDTSSALSFSAGSQVPITLEYYERGGYASISLLWSTPDSSSFVVIPASQLFHCTAASLAGFTLSAASTNASTCSPLALTLTARDGAGNPLSTYTGTVSLSTSTARGDWSAGSSPVPSGTLANGAANDGAARYTFAAADAGVAKLRLSESTAQDVVVTANDASVAGASSNSALLAFRDNLFSFAEDSANLIAGSDVAVAGRPHDFSLSLLKKDATTGSCGVATDFNGTRALKFWRTDTGTTGAWTAPAIASPALTVPATQPAASNLSLSFTKGVASFQLATTDIGRYSLNALDDSLSDASQAVSGSSNVLTVRPFALVIQGLQQGSKANPGGMAATDAVFGTAGSSFQASVGAYRWSSAMLSNGTDANNDGLPDSGATLANTVAGGLAPSFNSTLTLAPLAGSQTPAEGTLGSLANASVSSYSGGSATLSQLQYSEAGSFALATSGLVSNFLGSGLALDAVVFNAAGLQSPRVGRFIPAGFALSSAAVGYRPQASCSPAASFNYLDEPFALSFTLTAQNAQGGTTTNYTGAFAKLDPTLTGNWRLAGLAHSSSAADIALSSSGSPARLSVLASSGSWRAGVASAVQISAQVSRAVPADGPFSASLGIAPVDSDGVGMRAYDLDTTLPADGANDHTQLPSIALRHGRLRLLNAIGAADRLLSLPLQAQYWNGSAWAPNTLDSCTRVPATAVNFGNYRKTLTASDTALAASSTVLAAGQASLVLNPPASGHRGSVDVALSLGSSAADLSCLQPWSPGTGDAASAGAGLAYLRGAWCGAGSDKDPAARASFGLYRGADALIFSREHY